MNQIGLVRELDDTAWYACQHRSRRRGERAAAGRMLAAQCFCIAALLASLALWTGPSQFDTALRAVVAAGAAVVGWQAAAILRPGFTVPFAIIFLLFNPFVNLFNLAGAWKPGILAAAIGVFALSGIWLRPDLKHSNRL